MTYRKLPAGVQDVLPNECRVLTDIKERLQRRFLSCGFRPVLSAALEYYDTYSEISNRIAQERMFKLTDTDGKLLVLRPDPTLAISRIAATKLEDTQERLFYFADKWDMQNAGGIYNREIFQAGVECLGEEGAFSDAQAVAFAIECLKETGLTGFIVDIGHVGYFKGVLEGCGLSDEDAETVRRHINAKDVLNAERVLRRAGASEDTLNTLLALPSLFGGAEVLDRAEALTENACARGAIAHLKEVYSLLVGMGYEDCVSFDLGTVKRLSYYSGMVFSGLVKELGAEVLGGGRYDNLADDFGKHIPAIGFAMGLKRILIALERQGNLPAFSRPDLAIVCEKGAEAEGYREYQRRLEEGKSVMLFAESGKEAVSRAKKKAEKVYLAGRKGLKEV